MEDLKRELIEAIHATGTIPILGGIEYAEDIVQQININRRAHLEWIGTHRHLWA